jgi:hypothetical protein
MKRITTTLAVAAAALLLSSPAMAFHSGGVGECDGCHTMHNSLDNETMSGKNSEGVVQSVARAAQTNLGKAGSYLLRGSDQSSTCLNCHGDAGPGGYHLASPIAATSISDGTNLPYQFTPGGDFAWLKKTYTWTNATTAPLVVYTEEGETHGHSIVAADFGYTSDSSKPDGAPKGNSAITAYPTANLACSSCHDPHGRYRRTGNVGDTAADGKTAGVYTTTGQPIWSSGSYGATVAGTYGGFTPGKLAVGAYRILGGIGYIAKSVVGIADTFVANPPTAVAPSTYNVSETTVQLRVAYGKGMSEWCANCHAGMHTNSYTSGEANAVHPAGNSVKLSQGGIDAIYNAYIMTGNQTGVIGSAYNSLVPFETGSADVTVLLPLAAKNGITYGSTGGAAVGTPIGATSGNVMCLSCHRAHASGYPSMLRYQIENEFAMAADTAGNVIYPGTDKNPDASTPSYSKTRTNRGRHSTDYLFASYMRPADKFAPFQRPLCNKCHGKD